MPHRAVHVHGHARFNNNGHIWTSHRAWALFRLTNKQEVVCVRTYRQCDGGSPHAGPAPYFSKKEWKRMKNKALELLTTPLPLPANESEFRFTLIEEKAPHWEEWCERCKTLGHACNLGPFVESLADGRKYRVNKEDLRKHEHRLASCKPMELYHQTSLDSANAILASGQFRPGNRGLAGAGIYFATCEADTQHKAHQHGAILCATVWLGRSKKLGPNGGNITLEQLLREGCDSVRIERPGGVEYVVYTTDQVSNIRLAP